MSHDTVTIRSLRYWDFNTQGQDIIWLTTLGTMVVRDDSWIVPFGGRWGHLRVLMLIHKSALPRQNTHLPVGVRGLAACEEEEVLTILKASPETTKMNGNSLCCSIQPYKHRQTYEHTWTHALGDLPSSCPMMWFIGMNESRSEVVGEEDVLR